VLQSHVMAEVTERSFDLKSWQGLTLVLKVARESHLSPSAYAEFRNLVLEYAQEKGTNTELKKKIDAVIASFDKPEREGEHKSSEKNHGPEKLGRRIIPQFVQRETRKEVREEVQKSQRNEIQEVPQPRAEPQTPRADAPQPVPPVPPVTSASAPVPPPTPVVEVDTRGHSEAPKSVDEQRARIMEIKRRVNALVKNPVTLVDHGNNIGREYMVALLAALKATNPGATHDLLGAMAALEESFQKIVEYASHPHEHGVEEESTTAHTETAAHGDVAPIPETPVPEHVPEPVVSEPKIETPPMTQVEADPVPPIPVTDISPPLPPESSVDVGTSSAVVEEASAPVPTPEPLSSEETRWSEEGGDVDMTEQIRALRDQLGSMNPVPKGVRTGKRSLIPSILDMEEEVIPETKVSGTEWDPYAKKHADELSPAALTMRPTSTMTGITLGTPQAELMAPDVTMALSKLLHEWKIFASSGLFGMGPGGLEHPLYVKLSKLSMAEIITGRYDGADMKVVHSIKDYVDAWRHEQGVAYNPSETFEHYLRRVAQRILKRGG
jgi:hypothetical protein